MKALERIFLYTVLAMLVFYVFLIDNNAESQVAIQEEIRARRIVIVNDAGQEVVGLSANEDDCGAMAIFNKDGYPIVVIGANSREDGAIVVLDKEGGMIGKLP